MRADCVWKHNGESSLLYIENFVGAYARGRTLGEALAKCQSELAAYLRWRDRRELCEPVECAIVQEAACALHVADADSDVLFDSEKPPLGRGEYERLKALALRSAEDFLALYQSVRDPDASANAPRDSFYGAAGAHSARDALPHRGRE